MTRKVIYVSFGRLTDKIARDWYIDYLIEKGVRVEYWDVVALTRAAHNERGEENPEYRRDFYTYAELEAALRASDNVDACYVMLIGYAGRFTRIYRLLSKYDCRMLLIAWGAMPRDPPYKWRKIVAALSKPVWLATELLYRAKAELLRKLRLVKPYDIVFAAGDALMGTKQYARKVVPINLCDYDQYISAQLAAHRVIPEPYAVFLDINLPHQSDLSLCGYTPIDPIGYYRSLNSFFSSLERQFQIKVVIAAHPKADYDDATFEGRSIRRLITAELVRDAEFVISHTSTAQSYAVLNEKPLIFIYTNAMLAEYGETLIREMRCYADFLDAPIYNCDNIAGGHMVEPTKINRARYEQYKYNFLTTRESERVLTRDIFWRTLAASSFI